MNRFKQDILNNFNFNHIYVKFFLFLLTFVLAFVSMQGSFAADTNASNSSLSSSGYTISILDSSVGGDVKANPEISQNIPQTDLSNQIFEMTKQGSVVLKFGNGNGPTLLISTGIHGNEEEANIAVMKYLEYIKDMDINGTLYVIPFDIPLDTALNSREYKGTDPNRMANVAGTPGWNIVQFALSKGVDYILDVHSGSGVYSTGLINFNSAPTSQESSWINYIVDQTDCYTSSSDDSINMLRNYAHSKGINTLTFEVERDSIPTMQAAETEFKMILAACGYLGFPGAKADSPPSVISSDPINNANGVSLTAPITITFSENITAGPNYSGIYVKNLSTGNTVSISKTISGNILTIKQTLSRLNNNVYQVYIPAGAVKDAAGNSLAASYTYQFTTIAGSTDKTPPTVISTDPASGATGVSLTTPVTITFSENIAAGSNYSGIYIKNLSTGNTVSIASTTISGNTLTIKQTLNRLNNNTYQVYIPAGAVKDAAGNSLAASYTYQFQTVPAVTDKTPPTVTSTSPTSNAAGVSLTTPITIIFSENIVEGANFSGIYIKNLSTGATVSLASKTISGNTLTIKQTLNRLNNNTYQVYIPAGAVKDATGNSLAAAYTYNFTTVAATTDKTPPTVTKTSPASGATGVNLTSAVTITFSENIVAGSNYSGIYIKNLSTGTVVSLASKTISGNTLTIKQTYSRLSKNTYQVYIPAGAVKDAAGNSLAANYTYQFQTA